MTLLETYQYIIKNNRCPPSKQYGCAHCVLYIERVSFSRCKANSNPHMPIQMSQLRKYAEKEVWKEWIRKLANDED